MAGIDGKPRHGLQRTGFGGAYQQFIARGSQPGQVFAEHHAWHRQMKGTDLVVRHDGDRIFERFGRHGPILSLSDVCATFALRLPIQQYPPRRAMCGAKPIRSHTGIS
jgi:hypothetical protein